MKILAVLLALLGALALAFGVGLIFLPAGVIVGGLEALGCAYGVAYLAARKAAE